MKKGMLTTRQKRFVEHYLQCGVAGRAALQSGYTEGYGRFVLRKPQVQEYMQKRQAELRASIPTTEDVIQGLIEIATGTGENDLTKARIRAARIVVRSLGYWKKDGKI